MAYKERLDRIKKAVDAQALTMQQLSDMSGLSVSTISRTFGGKTDPTDYTLSTMEAALGITEAPIDGKIAEHAGADPMVERYIASQEQRIARIRAHYNMLLAEKNRWIKMSFSLNIILVIFIIVVLIYDALHPDIGWFQRGAHWFTGEGVRDALLSVWE